MRATAHACDFCGTILEISGSGNNFKKAYNACCGELGFSKGGWGFREDHVTFSYSHVCLDCWDQWLEIVERFKTDFAEIGEVGTAHRSSACTGGKAMTPPGEPPMKEEQYVKATPRPFTTPIRAHKMDDMLRVCDADNGMLFILGLSKRYPEESAAIEGRVKEIITAVNEHDQLKERVRVLEEALRGCHKEATQSLHPGEAWKHNPYIREICETVLERTT